MAVKTTVRVQEDYKKYVGFMEVEILPVVNPSLDKLKEMGYGFDQEPEYLKEVEEKNAEGETVGTVPQLSLVFYFKNKEGLIFNTKFFLKDRVRLNKLKNKKQYINAQGNSSFAESEDELQSWFTKAGGIRVGKDGEAELLEFLKTVLNKADYQKGFELTIDDWKKLMKGNVKEIVDILKDESVGPLLVPLVVRENEGKEYQQIFNRSIVPGYLMKNLRIMTEQGKEAVSDEKVQEWAEMEKRKEKLNGLQKAILKIKDREYGCQDEYYLGLAKEYKAGQEEKKSSEEKVNEPDGAGY